MVIVPSIALTTGEFALLESMGLSKPVLVFDAGILKKFLLIEKMLWCQILVT